MAAGLAAAALRTAVLAAPHSSDQVLFYSTVQREGPGSERLPFHSTKLHAVLCAVS